VRKGESQKETEMGLDGARGGAAAAAIGAKTKRCRSMTLDFTASPSFFFKFVEIISEVDVVFRCSFLSYNWECAVL
jgi:hypothetical protein